MMIMKIRHNESYDRNVKDKRNTEKLTNLSYCFFMVNSLLKLDSKNSKRLKMLNIFFSNLISLFTSNKHKHKYTEHSYLEVLQKIYFCYPNHWRQLNI